MLFKYKNKILSGIRAGTACGHVLCVSAGYSAFLYQVF